MQLLTDCSNAAQGAVQAMESQHGQRLGQEAERYASLQRDMARDREAAASDRQAEAEAHSRQVESLGTSHAGQLQVRACLGSMASAGCLRC